EWLTDSVRPETPYRISEAVEDGEALFAATKEHDLEGMMAKRKDGKYYPGKRSDSWVKVKVRQTAEVVIIGYTEGKGEREVTFGALHIADKTDDGLVYRGKVGTGFDGAQMKEISKQIKKLDPVKKPIGDKILDERVTQWIEDKLY